MPGVSLRGFSAVLVRPEPVKAGVLHTRGATAHLRRRMVKGEGVGPYVMWWGGVVVLALHLVTAVSSSSCG